MSNVFDGPPDGRQSDDQQHPTSRFRPTYRALSETEKALHDEVKDKAVELEALFQRVVNEREIRGREPQARYHALAMTALEEAVMWAVKGLTA